VRGPEGLVGTGQGKLLWHLPGLKKAYCSHICRLYGLGQGERSISLHAVVGSDILPSGGKQAPIKKEGACLSEENKTVKAVQEKLVVPKT
jgi:hypothetical protein